MFQLFRNSVSLVVQNIDIGTLSYKEYFHTEKGQFFKGQGHNDSKTEHFCQCSISEFFIWFGFLLQIRKIIGKRKPNIDLWVKRSKVNLPATFWLHFLSDRISFLFAFKSHMHQTLLTDEGWWFENPQDIKGQKGFWSRSVTDALR